MVYRVSRKGVPKPHPHDVLCGASGSNESHHGNKIFNDIVLRNKKLFSISPGHHKDAVAKGVVDAIRRQSPPGRFMALNRKEGLWYEIENRQAIGKTNKALKAQDKGKEGQSPATPSLVPPLSGETSPNEQFNVINQPSSNGTKSNFTTVAVPLKPPGGGAMRATTGNKRNRTAFSDGNGPNEYHAALGAQPKKIRPESSVTAPSHNSSPPPHMQHHVVFDDNTKPAPSAPQQKAHSVHHEPYYSNAESPGAHGDFMSHQTVQGHGGNNITEFYTRQNDPNTTTPGFLPEEPLDNEMERKLMQEYDERLTREAAAAAAGADGKRNVGGGSGARNPSLVRTESFPPPGLILPRTSFKADISGFGERAPNRRRSSRFSLTMPFGLGQRLSKLLHEPLPQGDDDENIVNAESDYHGDNNLHIDINNSGGHKERQLSLFEDDVESDMIQRLRDLDEPLKPSGGMGQRTQSSKPSAATIPSGIENKIVPTNTTAGVVAANEPALQPPELKTQTSLKREISDFFSNLRPTSILRGISVTGVMEQHRIDTAEEELDDAFLSHSERANSKTALGVSSTNTFDEEDIGHFPQENDGFQSAEPAEHRWSVSSAFLGGRRMSKLLHSFAGSELPVAEDSDNTAMA